MATVMQAKDAVSASLAECFVTIGDNRYNFMQAINLEEQDGNSHFGQDWQG